MKKFRRSGFNDIRFSTQTQEMTEIWSNEKKIFKGGNIFFWLGVYFLIWVGEMIFFDMAKKYTIFVQKLITQILFKIQKVFDSVKSLKC